MVCITTGLQLKRNGASQQNHNPWGISIKQSSSSSRLAVQLLSRSFTRKGKASFSNRSTTVATTQQQRSVNNRSNTRTCYANM